MNERTHDAQFTITRIFDAPRELVWRAWTESADAAEWWHPRGIEIKAGSVAVDARPGGRYAYTMVNPADGAEYPTAGVYREVDPPRRLVFTWASPGARARNISTSSGNANGVGLLGRVCTTRLRRRRASAACSRCASSLRSSTSSMA